MADPVTVHVGKRYRLQAQAVDVGGVMTPMPVGTLAWVSSDPTVATVTPAAAPGRPAGQLHCTVHGYVLYGLSVNTAFFVKSSSLKIQSEAKI